jgi:endonuclease/exonuclease/phosphatase (EEP) superfamily protein YafD
MHQSQNKNLNKTEEGEMTLSPSLWIFLGAIATGTAILSLVGFLGHWWWLFDLASHFRMQYFVLLVFLAVLFWLGRQPWAALGAAIFSLLNLVLVAALYFPVKSEPAQQQASYRLLLANVLQANQSYVKIRQLIRSSEPDFIVLAETNRDWLQALEDIRERYPYTKSAMREDNYGIAIFSRFPFEKAEIRIFGETGVPSIVLRLKLDGNGVTLIGTHPPPPKGPEATRYRNVQLLALADFASQIPDSTLLCGDLNLSPWSPYFRQVLQRSGLQNSLVGFGVQPSWPVDRPLFRVPIDHCLVSPGVRIQSRKLGPSVGSDHFPVIVDFSLENKRLVEHQSVSGRAQ